MADATRVADTTRAWMRPLCAAGAVTMLLLASGAVAQDQQSREREALARLRQQMSRLQQENGALQQQKAGLEQKLKAGEAELGKAKGEAGRLRRNASALRAAEKDKAQLQARLDAAEATLQELRQKHQSEVSALRSSLGEAETGWQQTRQEAAANTATLQGDLHAQTARAEVCETRNLQLYSVTLDLIERYKQNRGVWERFLLAEPFTQLKSVQVENLLADMRERADEARVETQASQ